MKCIHPTIINDGKGSRRLVPCGRCAWCRKKKRSEWFIRFLAESLDHPCYFLTLTYSDEWIPMRIVDDNGETFIVRGVDAMEGFVSIGSVPYLKDWQDYIKRVRKASVLPLKFFFVSEYGSLRGRVHYHALIWSDSPDIQYHLTNQWHFGDSLVEPAQEGSMKYVTKYILKGSSKKSINERDDNIKTNSSGIGESLWSKLVGLYLRSDYDSTFHYFGSIHAFPNYYKKKIRQYLDNKAFSVDIEITKDSKGEWRVKNKHCKQVQDLDDSRSIPEINDEDIIHQILRSRVRDAPSYLRDLYEKDNIKQFEINSKCNQLFNQ